MMKMILISFVMCFMTESLYAWPGDFQVKYGLKSQDELLFKKKSKKVWMVTFIDRGEYQRPRIFKKAFPSEVVLKQKSELSKLLLNFNRNMRVQKKCFLKFTLQIESSKRVEKLQDYCLDDVSQGQNFQLANWIQSVTRWFH